MTDARQHVLDNVVAIESVRSSASRYLSAGDTYMYNRLMEDLLDLEKTLVRSVVYYCPSIDDEILTHIMDQENLDNVVKMARAA